MTTTMSEEPVELAAIRTASGLTFTAWTAGPFDGEVVLLLHGFPQSRHAWRRQIPALAADGYRVIAVDQRGYSPGARPDPAELFNYRFDALVADAVEIVDAASGPQRRFHLVGHDWGGQVAWGVASRHPGRLASVAVLSRPHPSAFIRALKETDAEQKQRSRHHRSFLSPETGAALLADDALRLRRLLSDAGVPVATVAEYVSVLGSAEAIESALAWYRASPGLAAGVGMVIVPTLYIWGDADQTVGRVAAEGTADFVSADYRFAVLPGVGHFASDEQPDQVSALLREHVGRFPMSGRTDSHRPVG
jgi:pimeloyl-ACP methyl ester carboxylesterase